MVISPPSQEEEVAVTSVQYHLWCYRLVWKETCAALLRTEACNQHLANCHHHPWPLYSLSSASWMCGTGAVGSSFLLTGRDTVQRSSPGLPPPSFWTTPSSQTSMLSTPSVFVCVCVLFLQERGMAPAQLQSITCPFIHPGLLVCSISPHGNIWLLS